LLLLLLTIIIAVVGIDNGTKANQASVMIRPATVFDPGLRELPVGYDGFQAAFVGSSPPFFFGVVA